MKRRDAGMAGKVGPVRRAGTPGAAGPRRHTGADRGARAPGGMAPDRGRRALRGALVARTWLPALAGALLAGLLAACPVTAHATQLAGGPPGADSAATDNAAPQGGHVAAGDRDAGVPPTGARGAPNDAGLPGFAADAGADSTAAPLPQLSGDGFRVTRVAKWTALAASLGTTTYGITRQRAADHLHAEIERACERDPTRCGDGLTEGEFADPVLASRYRKALAIDRRARAALIASQVAVVATVALFLLDLDDRPRPVHDPYEPPMRIELGASTVGVSVRLPVATPGASSR